MADDSSSDGGVGDLGLNGGVGDLGLSGGVDIKLGSDSSSLSKTDDGKLSRDVWLMISGSPIKVKIK